MAVLCNNALIRDETLYGQPTEGALVACAMKHGLRDLREQYTRLHEIPFRYVRLTGAQASELTTGRRVLG